MSQPYDADLEFEDEEDEAATSELLTSITPYAASADGRPYYAPPDQLTILRAKCPCLYMSGTAIGGRAAEVEINGQMMAAPLPPEIIIQLINLTSSMLYYLISGCQSVVPPNPTPQTLQRFMTERPRFSARSMMIRRRARTMWRQQGLPPERVGRAVDEECLSMTGDRGLLRIKTAMQEVKTMHRMYIPMPHFLRFDMIGFKGPSKKPKS